MSRSQSYIQNSQHIWKLFSHIHILLLFPSWWVKMMSCRRMSLFLDHPSTKSMSALWPDSIYNVIYFHLWYARYTWSTRWAIEPKVFCNLEPWFYQMIEAFLAVSTTSTAVVPQPVVSFTAHSFIHFHLPYILNKIENKSETNNQHQTHKNQN